MGDWNFVYQEMKSWQTGIGALLGFVTLGVAALINYYLGRRRDKHLRKEEAASISLALYGEILLLRESSARLARYVASRYIRNGLDVNEAGFDKYFQEMVEIPEPRVFPALVHKVGILPPNIALEIGKFYARIDEVKAWLPRLQDDPERSYSYSILHVIEPAVNAVRLVEPALREIERFTAIDSAVLELDVGDAMTAWDIEQEFQASRD